MLKYQQDRLVILVPGRVLNTLVNRLLRLVIDRIPDWGSKIACPADSYIITQNPRRNKTETWSKRV